MGRQVTSFCQSYVALIQLCAKKYITSWKKISGRRAVPRVNQLSNQLRVGRVPKKKEGLEMLQCGSDKA
ncbi:hypothetical protein pdam_00002458 [Pocillopora damicornis]|uniref:Uncharacterized protein n=1 Tax=Pocillopora damicornis TaxID=46731 RepID=A0A3M6TRU1_POCDA|nr:hypothetical protein pdam_00002458 [Pocillopora damicornis]